MIFFNSTTNHSVSTYYVPGTPFNKNVKSLLALRCNAALCLLLVHVRYSRLERIKL